MLVVIGKIGCTKCHELSTKLTEQGVEHRYYLYDKLPAADKRHFAQRIREENDGHFPLILKDNTVIKEEDI